MNAPKKHHYVPQLVLRRFCDGDGKLWLFNKKAPHLGVHSGSPESVFYETHLYSLRENGVRDSSLETYFSELESSVAGVIEKLCSSGRLGFQPRLTAPEKRVWDEFMWFQWKRTPDSLTSTLSDFDFDRRLEDAIEEFEDQVRPITNLERENILSLPKKKELRENVRVKVMGHPGFNAQEVLENTGLAVAVVRKPNKSFVIGSRPVLKLTPPGETRLGQAGVEAWLPIAHDVAICVIPGKGNEVVLTLDDDRKLRDFNRTVLGQSTMIAGRSEALVKSLVSPS